MNRPMRVFFGWMFLVLGSALGQKVTLEEAYSILGPIKGVASKGENSSGIEGKVLTGYQGWFRAPGDGSGMGFHHFEKGGKFEPGHCTIDLWPDLSDFDEDEKFDTPFRHADGSTAQVFSSVKAKTVNRHFQWMQDYGIDGAFVQRFALHGAKNHRSFRNLKFDNLKLMHCREAAHKNGRCYAVMYDLSGLKSGDFERLNRDWKMLKRKMKLGFDPNDRAYLRYKGKPLVAIWGVGFSDKRDYQLEDAEKFIRFLKHNPEWGGVSVMLGVPFYWREGKRDAVEAVPLHRVLKMADIISPWAVGRYHEVNYSEGKHVTNLVEDRKWCERQKICYLPVVYPGFSWHNLKGDKINSIPRRKGKFLWDQFVAVRSAGIETAYVAMFDEIDEATAIFKVSDHPPVGDGVRFLDNDGLPSDHYLKVTQQGGKLLRGEVFVD